jgi:hypothetical protein
MKDNPIHWRPLAEERLIAAAPELLAALRDAVTAILDPPRPPSGRVELVSEWVRLIARIEGEP